MCQIKPGKGKIGKSDQVKLKHDSNSPLRNRLQMLQLELEMLENDLAVVATIKIN